jgi:hypothetical protein
MISKPQQSSITAAEAEDEAASLGNFRCLAFSLTP